MVKVKILAVAMALAITAFSAQAADQHKINPSTPPTIKDPSKTKDPSKAVGVDPSQGFDCGWCNKKIVQRKTERIF